MIQVRKAKSGKPSLFGKFSNRWRDRDFHADPLHGGEIVTRAAHQEYVDWVSKNAQHMPELWIWHIHGSALKNRANWIGFSGNFLYANWELTDDEAKAITDWQKELQEGGESLGMSFGFYVFDRDERAASIEKYRAFEASLLPVSAAANAWTGAELVGVESKEKGMFNADQIKALVKIHGKEFAEQLLLLDMADAEALDAAGVDTKAATEAAANDTDAESGEPVAVAEGEPEAAAAEEPEAKEDTEPEATETETAVEAQPEPGLVPVVSSVAEADVVKALEGLNEAFNQDVEALAAQLSGVMEVVAKQQQIIEAMSGQIAALSERASAEDAEAKQAAAPAGALATFAPRSILNRGEAKGEGEAENTAEIDGRSTLARQGQNAVKSRVPSNFVDALFS